METVRIEGMLCAALPVLLLLTLAARNGRQPLATAGSQRSALAVGSTSCGTRPGGGRGGGVRIGRHGRSMLGGRESTPNVEPHRWCHSAFDLSARARAHTRGKNMARVSWLCSRSSWSPARRGERGGRARQLSRTVARGVACRARLRACSSSSPHPPWAAGEAYRAEVRLHLTGRVGGLCCWNRLRRFPVCTFSVGNAEFIHLGGAFFHTAVAT